ncbi:hypothetical protein VPHD85_0038 [Vibrio phage D85]
MSKPGFVYIAKVNGRIDLFKIGYTTKNPEARVEDLHKEYPSYSFSLAKSFKSERPRRAEQFAHELLECKRFHREIFNCTLSQAEAAIKECSNGRYKTFNSHDDAMWAAHCTDEYMFKFAKKHKAVFLYLVRKFCRENKVRGSFNFIYSDFCTYIERKTKCLCF